MTIRKTQIQVANAPCSWGVLEFESKTASPGYRQVLDEIAESGYDGTELGDWGFMPTEAAALGDELRRRRLEMLGAFVTTRLADRAAFDESIRTAMKTARLLAAVDEGSKAFIVLSDEPTANPVRARTAGRVDPSSSLTEAQWDNAASGVERLARAVRDDTGLRTVFHHHCATHVETSAEIDALMQRTNPALLGLCFDSGHVTYGGGSAVDLLSRYRDRIWHVHFKDCDAAIATRSRQEQWDYETALRHGVFCELGQGGVDFPALLGMLRSSDYDGWIVVEQDVLPEMGAPLASAIRNRKYLRSLGV